MITPTVPVPAVPSSEPSHGARAGGANLTGTLMARWSHRSPAAAADSVWVPLASGALILAAGAMALATGSPWLFAALGPTAVIVAASPGHPTTRFHSIVLGHLTALLCGWLAVLLMGTGDAPALLGSHVTAVSRVWASAAAVALTALVQPSVRAYHPPAAATALLITIGVYNPSWKSFMSLMAGTLAVALLGEWLQRVRLRESQSSRRA
jgi:CBS-domain-containing membrane protein